MKHPPFFFDDEQLAQVGECIGRSRVDRLIQHILALTVQRWHVHMVIGTTHESFARVVKCAKDAARWGLRPDRPIWSHSYDKRYCFDSQAVVRRVRYVERHNERMSRPVRPWGFIQDPPA